MKYATPVWLVTIALFSLLAASIFQTLEIRRNNQLLEQQAAYVHVQHKLESNEHFINDAAFRKIFLKAEAESQLVDSEIVLVYSYHFNTYLKWQWEWQQLYTADPERIPLPQWGSYLRVYPLTLEAWEWRKSHFSAEFVRFFEEVLEPDSRRVD